MHRLDEREEGCFYIDHPADFRVNGYLSFDDIDDCFDFAYNMTFGDEGKHRDRRSGGQAHRKNGEIFADTFQGKLAEFAFYNLFKNSDVEIKPPDTTTMGLTEWDSSDFTINGLDIAIKSTKHFGNLLLLETKDWDVEGRYIPNYNKGHSEYDYFVLERIFPECSSLMKQKRWLYSDSLGYDDLKSTIIGEEWKVNIVGFITREDFVSEVIKKRMIIPQNALLNGHTVMDAENYYVQSGDLRPMSELIRILRNEETTMQ